jgi:menaquinone-dependent protoporphyrinogen IX oxidase
MQSKTLVAHISAGGATATYARIIAETLKARGHDVDVVDLKRDKIGDLAAYDCVVAGMGVRMGMVYRRGKQFLRRADLKGKKLGVFLSSGMAIAEPEKARTKFLDPLLRKAGLEPVMCEAFPGIMPSGPGKTEDETDPERARKWAESLADELSDSA